MGDFSITQGLANQFGFQFPDMSKSELGVEGQIDQLLNALSKNTDWRGPMKDIGDTATWEEAQSAMEKQLGQAGELLQSSQERIDFLRAAGAPSDQISTAESKLAAQKGVFQKLAQSAYLRDQLLPNVRQQLVDIDVRPPLPPRAGVESVKPTDLGSGILV